MAREINLVPDIKDEMIKTLKLRNLIFFLCIVVASASVGVVLFFGTIAGGQQIAIDGKNNMINNLSKKLKSYNDLSDFLTIKNQLGNLNTISENKKVLSRTFNILSAMIPNGADYVRISELNINLTEENPTYVFEAQANAGKAPFIDYKVLDSFKKSMRYMKYDYGNYVDKNGAVIPSYCIIESDKNGATFNDKRDNKDNYYGLWTITGEGCNPSAEPKDESEEELEQIIEDNEQKDNNAEKSDEEKTEIPTKIDGYETEEYEGQAVVRIWRTPQYDTWFREEPSPTEPSMDSEGNITNVQHFESACYTYKAEFNSNNDQIKWTTDNSCFLVPGADKEEEDKGVTITESSNGRDSSDDLVLRFSAVIILNPEVYKFSNEHFMAIAPEERRNVTDSYDQLQALFTERAADCEEDDTACAAENTDETKFKKKEED